MKVYRATNTVWGLTAVCDTREGAILEVAAGNEGLATVEEIEKTDYLLSQIPEEFRSCVGYMAYERGHSAGLDEVELILTGLVHGLKPCIEAFQKRLTGGK